MMARFNAVYATAMACLLAGCADGGLTAFNTGSIDPQKQAANEQAEKSKQALCNTLVSQIEGLNSEGTSDKVAKAAAKKYKLKPTDISKADELNKANTEFQAKCSSYPPRVATTAPLEPVTTAAVAPGAAPANPVKPAAKVAKSATPAQKPLTTSLMPQEATTERAANAPAASDAGTLPAP